MAADKIAYRFVGPRDTDGAPQAYLGGVPAEHLTQADYDALPPERQAAVAASALYKATTEKAAHAPAPKETT